jgi:hypothetical protein
MFSLWILCLTCICICSYICFTFELTGHSWHSFLYSCQLKLIFIWELLFNNLTCICLFWWRWRCEVEVVWMSKVFFGNDICWEIMFRTHLVSFVMYFLFFICMICCPVNFTRFMEVSFIIIVALRSCNVWLNLGCRFIFSYMWIGLMKMFHVDVFKVDFR